MTRSERGREIRRFLLRQIPEHPKDVARLAADEFGVTRQAVNRHLRRLAEEGLIEARGHTRARVYSLVRREGSWSFSLEEGFEEHRVWAERLAPKLEGLADNVVDVCHYGLTEMLNNALEHSEGSRVEVLFERDALEVGIDVWDDGVGIFRKIADAFGLDGERDAVLELSKGKLTTDPERHTGEGIFFTSRMFDSFSILSHRLVFTHRADSGDWLLSDRDPTPGTFVRMEIATDADRSPRQVFDRFTEDEDYSFSVTHVPVALARYGEENLVSRSQARRLVARFGEFRRVVLDFSGVESIGQAFADEVFRVWQREHPDVELTRVKAAEQVEKMIRRARSKLRDTGEPG